jgi:hypothetical protein
MDASELMMMVLVLTVIACIQNYFLLYLHINISFPKGCQLDFFVVSYLNYLVMELGNQAYMEFKQCTPLNYATEEMLRWLEADTTAVSHILTDERGDKDIKMVELNSKIELPKAVVI